MSRLNSNINQDCSYVILLETIEAQDLFNGEIVQQTA